MTWYRHRRWLWLAVPFFIALLGFAAFSKTRHPDATRGSDDIPVVLVELGDLNSQVFTIGDVRSSNSAALTAPPIGGGGLQITKLLPSGTKVKKGDVVIEFDPSEQEYLLEQNRSELLQADQSIEKAKADAAVQTAQDQVALLKARFDVRRAELEVGKNELVSTIDARKNALALEQAKRILDQMEHDVKSHAALNKAGLAVAEERRHKATLAMEQAQQNMEKMHVRAPMDGVVGLEMNVNATGGMFWGGMTVPDYRQGDQVQPGSLIARIIDPNAMEVGATINERERGNLKIAQSVEIELDAYPGEKLQGKIKALSGMASRNFWETESGGKFDITIEFPKPDPRLRSGLTVQAVIFGEKKTNVLTVPRQAVFMKDGKRVTYTKNGDGFTSREVKILGETESRTAVEGLKKGDEVALIDPSLPRSTSRKTGSDAGGFQQ